MESNYWLHRSGRSTDGETPSIRLNVRLMWAASAKPAAYAASPIELPLTIAEAARCTLSHARYGRSGIPIELVKTCINRLGDRSTRVASTSSDVASSTPLE